MSGGTQNFNVAVPSTPTLVLDVSEDAWQGDAQFTVTVDGQQVGGTYTATASHSAGQTQAISIPTSLSPGQHNIGVNFLNDAYAGPGADRNLYVDGATYNGTPIANSNLALMSGGTQNFNVAVPSAPSTTVTSTTSVAVPSTPALVLDVSEDAWQGDAQFTVSVDGQQVGGTYTATASHSAGQTQAISIPTSLSAASTTSASTSSTTPMVARRALTGIYMSTGPPTTGRRLLAALSPYYPTEPRPSALRFQAHQLWC